MQAEASHQRSVRSELDHAGPYSRRATEPPYSRWNRGARLSGRLEAEAYASSAWRERPVDRFAKSLGVSAPEELSRWTTAGINPPSSGKCPAAICA